MPNYAKTIIYKIVCKDINIKKTYGGHTTNIIKRRQQHKSVCNNINSKKYNYYVYKFIRENGGYDNWEMLWIYDFPCNSKKEAELEERNFIEKEKCELNSQRPYVTEEENKENYKKWCEENKNKILEKQKKYQKENSQKLKEYAKNYREENKEKAKEYQKNYTEENQEKLKEKASIKYTCVCGSTIRLDSKSKHEKTKKHLKFCEKI
jgi:hypothetical protein